MKTLLFDADGTLLDFKRSEAVGLEHVFEEFDVPEAELCRTYYLELNERLWHAFELGRISKQHIFDVRFQETMDHFHLERDGKAMEACYRSWLNQGSHLIPGALSLIQELAKAYPLYIVTNGVSKTQHLRLQDSGLKPYFKDVFVSEAIGYQKPDPAYFDYVVEHVPASREELLLIGDSLHSDILGANQAGITSCWYNPDHLQNHTDIQPDMELYTLEELWDKL